MRKQLLLLLLLLLNTGFSFVCTADSTEHGGTCINLTYSFFGRELLKSCDYDPYYDDGSLWVGYVKCTATISDGSVISDDGSIVAIDWSTNTNQLTECVNHNGVDCDVNPTNGFNPMGKCDASDANCVSCSNGREVNSWKGGPFINGVGDGLCESGCGASSECDEKPIGSLSINSGCNNNCIYEYCGAFKWDSDSNSCFTSCSSRDECVSSALCLNGVCINDFSAPSYDVIGYTDLTPTPDDSLITGDSVRLFVHWVDNFNIDSAILWINTGDGWSIAGRIDYTDKPSGAWSNFTIKAVSGVTEWKVVASDVVGNTKETTIQSFTAYDPSNAFSITNHLTFDNILLFSGWVTAEANKPADNSFLSSSVGDFVLTREGIGTRTRYGFKLDEPLPQGIIIKLSNQYPISDYSPTKLINLNSDEFVFPDWCQSNLPGDTCNVWVFMDLAPGFEPMNINDKIIIISEEV